MKKQHQRDFLEIEKAVKSRIRYLPSLNFSEEETKTRIEELKIILKKISNVKYYRLNPLEKVTTVTGITFKIGDKFHIRGDLISQYKIVAFPNSVSIRGKSANPDIGKPWTCEVYLEDAIKVKKDKKKSKKTKTKRLKKKK